MPIGYDMTAYMGIRAMRELEVVSQNLANASTVGFKRELLNIWSLGAAGPALPPEPQSVFYVDVISRDFSQGSLHTTEGENDLALEGPGFFKIQTPRGIRYTRNGCFRLSPKRQLVTQEGFAVLGKNGPLTLDAIDKKFSVDEQGGIHLDKSLSDQLVVVNFPNPQDLRPEGDNYLVAGPDTGEEIEAQDTRVHQGMIEESNIDPVAEAVNLMRIHRSFETYLKVMDTFASMDRNVVEDIGQG